MSEATLAERLRANFIAFYDHEYHRIVRFLMHCGASQPAAEDAAQDAFLDAWDLTVRGTWMDIDNQRAWIRKVARRKYDRPPGQRQRPPVLSVPELPDMPQPGFGSAEDLAAETIDLLRALRRLDPELREIMALHLDDFSAIQIAAYLGTTDQKVRDQCKKARKILAVDLAGIRFKEGRRTG
jgi:RNA polymerase sigma-70 factor (ECF subfamily)